VSFELFQAAVEVVKDFLDEQVKIGPVKVDRKHSGIRIKLIISLK